MHDGSHLPPLPDEDAILRSVLDDEPLSPEALEHVNSCSLCQMHVSRFKRMNAYLLKNLYRSTCPSITLLNQYCAQLLSDQETAALSYHIKNCPLCAQEVEVTRQVLADFEPFPS